MAWLCLLAWAGPAQALTAEQALAMAVGDTDDRVAAVQQAIVQPDEQLRAEMVRQEAARLNPGQ